MVLEILYWVLLILAIIGVFVPDTAGPYIGRSRWAVVLILMVILGLRVFNSALLR